MDQAEPICLKVGDLVIGQCNVDGQWASKGWVEKVCPGTNCYYILWAVVAGAKYCKIQHKRLSKGFQYGIEEKVNSLSVCGVISRGPEKARVRVPGAPGGSAPEEQK